MKILLSVLLIILTAHALNAQRPSPSKKLIILVRHAEKADNTNADPDLSPAGRDRAKRLIGAIGKYRPGAFFSTDFKRTRDTIAPLAKRRNKQLQIYDAKKPRDLIDAIAVSKTKRIVIAGHSNSIPGLANLLIKKDLFKNLDESEYTVIWLVRIKDGQVRTVELLDY
ncbi:MAG: phosphoglycerate mutase family protein [Pyrinomonadaceae bacterium]